jgi:hypothetical protein
MTRNFFLVMSAVFLGMIFPLKALAYGAMADGGMLQGESTECTCSAGETIRVNSYVDNSSHIYLWSYITTMLYENYGVAESGNYFLATLTPAATCLVIEGEECDTQDNPEGVFTQIGTSFNTDKNSFMALFKELPLVPEMTKAFSEAIPNMALSSPKS